MTTNRSHQGSYLIASGQHTTVTDAMRAGAMRCQHAAPTNSVARTTAIDMDLVRTGYWDGGAPTAGDIAAAPVSFKPSLPLQKAVRLMDEHETGLLLVAVHRATRGNARHARPSRRARLRSC
jgi:hypothetical protein